MEIPDDILEESLRALCERNGAYEADSFEMSELAIKAREEIINYIKQSIFIRRERIAKKLLSITLDDVNIK